MEQPKSISKWIESMSMRGHYVFTKNDLCSTFPDMSPITFQRNLTRLMAKNAIVSPWHNFYVIVPTEYKLKGIVPPVFYLDHLMRYLGCQYYVALLNAAEMYGAAHQRPQKRNRCGFPYDQLIGNLRKTRDPVVCIFCP